MSTTRKRSNVVTKALLITALASGIAGMQAQPAFAETLTCKFYRLSQENPNVDLINGIYDSLTSSLNIATEDFNVIVKEGRNTKTYTVKKGELYHLSYTQRNDTDNGDPSQKIYTVLGDAKSILGGSSSGELSEEQKTIVKNLIANWPRVFRLVEKFFERNDDYNEYDKKT